MNKRVSISIRAVSVLLVLLLAVCQAIAAEGTAGLAGLSDEEAIRLGEAMYLKGKLPSGKPMKAVVQGDIILTGTMVTCSNCHMRSGLGSYEGTVLTPPTNGAKLYAPIRGRQDLPGIGMWRSEYTVEFKYQRPAYTDESLAKALWFGIDPTGRQLSKTMPRYVLEEDAMKIMIFYLKNLSSRYSPGVTEDSIRVATVITDDVSTGDRDAMLNPLKAYIKNEWNATVAGSVQAQRESAYRPLTLDVWELKGPAGTWKEQLEAYYAKQPVFALLSGISTKKWAPVHEFCERNRVPCILPATDLPVISKGDWYTLYFSKGYYQEGETAGKYLARTFDLPADKQIVQVFRDNDEGRALSTGFEDTWRKLGKAALKSRIVPADSKTDADYWKALSAENPNAVMLLWLGPEDLKGVESLGNVAGRPSTLFVSLTMLGGALSAIPDAVRDFTFITYPTRLPDEQRPISIMVEQWLKARKVESSNMVVSSKVYFLAQRLTNYLSIMKGNLYRDYFLDIFDEGEDQFATSATYPRLTFGPGQRYASKGCYVVTITKGAQPNVIRQSNWIIY